MGSGKAPRTVETEMRTRAPKAAEAWSVNHRPVPQSPHHWSQSWHSRWDCTPHGKGDRAGIEVGSLGPSPST